ncbi:hypothetical protein BOTBODRAFT_58495 [Botryobasidium botryosum FD-172 SS1]|uniref:Uncharacterized protein n=1 Tax=Botryobasidium botryosum (strain FD-172 SS1) TaxID=930990 RepID=A0A067M1S4_BOTB1|nr:hypothetical protein BOTBODRAFT_58495 [Botryobasidium botryosum FD-172 SS1]
MASEAIARATQIDAGFAITASLTGTPVVPDDVTPSVSVPISPVLGPVLEPTVVEPVPNVSELTHTPTADSALATDITPSASQSSTTSALKVANDEHKYLCCVTGPPSGSRTPYFVPPQADTVPELEEDMSGWTVVGRRRRPRPVDIKGKGRAPPELDVSA